MSLEALAASVQASFDDAKTKLETKTVADTAAYDASIALEAARTSLQTAKDALITALTEITV